MIKPTDKVSWVGNLENLQSIRTETEKKTTLDSLLKLHICHLQTKGRGLNQLKNIKR